MDNFISLSEDELYEKINELNRKMIWAGRFGSGELFMELQRQFYLIQAEQSRRIYTTKTPKALSPVVIETDPDMAKEQKEIIEKKEAERTVPSRNSNGIHREKIVPTLEPPRK